MHNADANNKKPRPVAGPAHASDWFFDELMTGQPEATRDFYRARLLRPAEDNPANKTR